MHPLVKTAPFAVLFALLSTPPPSLRSPSVAAPAVGARQKRSPCPEGTLLEPFATASARPLCLPLPKGTHGRSRLGHRPHILKNSQFRLRFLTEQNKIARYPEREAEYGLYLLPVSQVIGVHPPEPAPGTGLQRQGIVVETEANAPVTLVPLEGETQRPKVLLVGDLYGKTVIVHHRLRIKTDKIEDYVVIYGNLARPGPGIVNGATLGPMSVIGFLAERPAERSFSHLYFEVRRLHQPWLKDKDARWLMRAGISTAEDARNLLRLRADSAN